MNVVIFLGPAGSGKGTQANYLNQEHDFIHISTGDLLRTEVENKTNLGNKISGILKSGKLVSDKIILDMIELNFNTLTKKKIEGVIFDGFPRTIDQAKGLDILLKRLKFNISSVFYFNLTLKESMNRISGRRIDSRNNNIYHMTNNPPPEDVIPFLKERNDDEPEKVRFRYEIYKRETLPLLDYYKHILVNIDCNQSIANIRNTFESTFQKIN